LGQAVISMRGRSSDLIPDLLRRLALAQSVGLRVDLVKEVVS
jgi:hypothetical protein